ESKMSIENISFECGFSTQRTFNRVFFELIGMTPSEYRNNDLNKIND
ncbi:MAG: AraC family transcriptional regulator, partial [Clostridiales bacterium]|nr:AraC family transcriptional regulator [Clostridiales bacterium]